MVLSVYSPNWAEYDSYGILAGAIASRAACKDTVNRLGTDVPDGTRWIPSPGGIFLGYPTLIDAYSPIAKMGRRVAVTMFESTGLPEGWVEALNQYDAVVVPARFLVDVFRANGVTSPIHVVALGVAEAYLQVERKPRDDRPFTYLAIADRGIRKGWDVVWHAFRNAFGDSTRHRLILKCRADGMIPNSADANVKIMRADLSVQEMAELYARCDCFVFPTRGEGFGLPPREFAATGGIALATEWGGTADDIDSWGFRIPYKFVDAWPHHESFVGRCGQWAEPDVKKLADQLRVVAAFEAMFMKSARKKREKVRELYSWTGFADRVLEIYYGT